MAEDRREPDPVRRVDDVLHEVPRDNFIGSGRPARSMVAGRSIPPLSVARQMLHALALRPGERLLQVGTGSGYIAVLAARLGASVFTVERVPTLCAVARHRFAACGCPEIQCREGDGQEGWAEHGPFDAILVSTADLPDMTRLFEQLRPGGRLVALETEGGRDHTLVRYIQGTDPGRSPAREELGTVRFVSEVGEVLLEMGLVDQAALDEARRRARAAGTDVTDELRGLVRIDEADVARAVARQRGLGYGEVDPLLARVDTNLFEQMPRAFLDYHRVIPLSIQDGTVLIATSNPDAPVEDLQKVFPGREIDLRLVTPTAFRRLWATIDLWLNGEGPSPQEVAQTPEADDLVVGDHAQIEPRIVSLFEAMLLDAIGEAASDIHLERFVDRVRVRLRVDGELLDLQRYSLGPDDLAGLINVIKVRAQLDIAERRLPQGGRIRLRAAGAVYDLRVQTQPCLHGEHAVIRLLPQNIKLLSIQNLGLPEVTTRQYTRMLANPTGLVLVVGPTGSGKSTTLYAGLQLLADEPTRKVITVEDPIEYSIDGIQQTRVRPDIGFSFADAMRSFVRQDPDVILVGEIRDAETALEALRASQTGHVVLSTLHCNDSVDAVQRLYDLGMHPNSIASELVAVLAQRLAKRICSHCKDEAEPDPAILAEVFPDGAPASFRTYRGRGCDRCGGRGTRGRVAVVEYLQVGNAFRGAISRQPAVQELRQIALDSGLLTMRDTAIDHVTTGTIPLEELPRILPMERMAPEARR